MDLGSLEREALKLRHLLLSLGMMAHKQQPLYLHLAELTASQFLDIWKHYDSDGKSNSYPKLYSVPLSNTCPLGRKGLKPL